MKNQSAKSIEDQVRRKQASAEQAIRDQQAFEKNQQAFEKRLREFLSLASGMTNQELEIALARLADKLEGAKADPESIRIKGIILNIYYKLRAVGLRKQSTLARVRHFIPVTDGLGTSFSESLITALAGYPLLQSSAAAPAYPSDEAFNARIKLLAP